MKPTRLQKKIFKLAAERIASELSLFCCCAIEDVASQLGHRELAQESKDLFRAYYAPQPNALLFWSGPDQQDCRILALLILTHL